MKTFSIEGY